jgi:hypothetical protein
MDKIFSAVLHNVYSVRLFFIKIIYSLNLLNSDFSAPQRGQTQSSGKFSHFVPGAIPHKPPQLFSSIFAWYLL